MKVLEQPIFFHYLEVSFIERYKSIEVYAMVHWKNFIMRVFSLLGEFIIGGSTVHTQPPTLVNAGMSPCRQEFAYATSDGQVFVRQFAVRSQDWHLVRTLVGHTAEVTQVS